MSTKDTGGLAGAIPLIPETCPADEFENAIRKVGVIWACSWFGYEPDSEFTQETIRVLQERSEMMGVK